MAEVNDSLIKQGLWINWSQGRVLGSTLTTSTRAGSIVIAVLALTVALATSHFWNLLLFLFYQQRARNATGDGLFHQQQATLRSLPAPEAFAVDIIKLHLTWLRRLPNTLSRSLYISFTALIYFLAALTAGVFSSSVVATSDLLLLVDGKNCTSMDIFDAWLIQRANASDSSVIYDDSAVTLSRQYADRCYGEGPPPSECNIYVQPSIKSDVSMVSCPFESSMCLGSGNVAVALDSGLVDSRSHLGINTRSEDRIQFRKRTTCAPLAYDNYSAYVDAQLTDIPQTLPGDEYFILYYGTSVPNSAMEGATFLTSEFVANKTGFFSTRAGYQFASPEAEVFTNCLVNATLQRSDADVILLGIAKNAVSAIRPLNDPIFAFHNNFTHGTNQYFRPDVPLSAIGCIEQYQICIDDGQNCSPLQAVAPHIFAKLPDGISDFQRSVAQLLTQAVWLSDVGVGFSNLDSHSFLKAAEKTSNAVVSHLPDNQWVIEVTSAVNWAWSGVQRTIQDHATGFIGIPKAATLYPKTNSDKKFCQSQLVKKTGGFANISVFGLFFVVAVSGFTVLISFIPLRFLVSSKRCGKIFSPAVDRWNQDGALQVQRRVFQGYGYGQWSKLDREIPVTQAGDLLPRISTLPLATSTNQSWTTNPKGSRTDVTITSKPSIQSTQSSISQPQSLSNFSGSITGASSVIGAHQNTAGLSSVNNVKASSVQSDYPHSSINGNARSSTSRDANSNQTINKSGITATHTVSNGKANSRPGDITPTVSDGISEPQAKPGGNEDSIVP